MHPNSILFRLLLTSICCLHFVFFSQAQHFIKNDSLRAQEFINCTTDEERVNLLLEYELPSITEFSKSNSELYQTFATRLATGNNARLKYKISYLNGLIKCEQGHSRNAIPILLEVLNNKDFITQADSVEALIRLKLCFARLLNYPKVFETHQELIALVKRNPALQEKSLSFQKNQKEKYLNPKNRF